MSFNSKPKILAIETSCDECSAAVVTTGKKYAHVLSNTIFSQIELHRRFGGVVPEVASRNHLEMISPVIEEALKSANVSFKDLTGIAVTSHPGLVGALLVGVSTAKTMAYSLKIPLVSVNHLEGHLHSLFIEEQKFCEIKKQNLPLLICLVSGGHTNLYLVYDLPPQPLRAELLGSSRDDAAGEAFDKTAKLLGLPYPGGVYMDQNAKQGNPKAFHLTRPLTTKLDQQNFDFSFSGLKTATLNLLLEQGFKPQEKEKSSFPKDQLLSDFCASIQEAIVDTLLVKIKGALKKTNAKGLAIVGGVSANSRLREKLADQVSVPVFFPDSKYCTDNAAMIGSCGLFQLMRGEVLNDAELLALAARSS